MDRSLNIPEPQILLHFPEDAGGYFHHHRILMHRVSGSQWVLLTLDLELEVADLSARRHRILPRHGVFPADIADECYVFDEVPRAEMERQRRMAKTMGSILGDAQVVNVDIQQWYVSDPSSARFGQALPVEIVGDVVALGQHGVCSGMMKPRMCERWRLLRSKDSRSPRRIHWGMLGCWENTRTLKANDI